MRKKRNYSWFIEPRDSHTNEVLARELTEDDFKKGVLCVDGRHNLWQCPWDFVRNLIKSRKTLKVNFKVFNQQGNGAIRECMFLKKKEKNSGPAVAAGLFISATRRLGLWNEYKTRQKKACLTRNAAFLGRDSSYFKKILSSETLVSF